MAVEIDSTIDQTNQDVEGEIQSALDELNIAREASRKQRKTLAEAPLKRICSLARQHGLSGQSLASVIDIITQPDSLDASLLDRLLRDLYPAQGVPDIVVVKVVGSLGQGALKPLPSLQAGLLKWLILVYDVIDNPNILSSLYGTLFNLLDTISLRKPLCHLLALITHRKHVRPFRMQMLIELSRRAANEPGLQALIGVYKDFYPDVFAGVAISERAAIVSHPDPGWLAHLVALQDGRIASDGGEQPKRAGFKAVKRGRMMKRISTIPELRTTRANENSVTLEEIRDVDDLINNLEKLELPSQAVSILGHSLPQRLLTLRPSDSASRRIHNWLVAFFDEELKSIARAGGRGPDRLQDVLDVILDHTQLTKTLPSACRDFLKAYLPDWDGDRCRDVVLKLLTYLPIEPFEEFRINYLVSVEEALLDDTSSSKLILLDLLSGIIHSHTVIQLGRRSQPGGKSAQTLSSISTDSENVLFFSPLAEYADTLCLSAIESAADPPFGVHAILSTIIDFRDVFVNCASRLGLHVSFPPSSASSCRRGRQTLRTILEKFVMVDDGKDSSSSN